RDEHGVFRRQGEALVAEDAARLVLDFGVLAGLHVDVLGRGLVVLGLHLDEVGARVEVAEAELSFGIRLRREPTRGEQDERVRDWPVAVVDDDPGDGTLALRDRRALRGRKVPSR